MCMMQNLGIICFGQLAIHRVMVHGSSTDGVVAEGEQIAANTAAAAGTRALGWDLLIMHNFVYFYLYYLIDYNFITLFLLGTLLSLPSILISRI